jgi:hypothetical protein
MMWDDPVLPVRGEHYCPDHPDVAVHWFKYPNGDVEYLCGMRLPRADVRKRCSCGKRAVGAALMCAACSHATHSRRRAGELPVECWCSDTTVWVQRRLLLAGLTRSCGLEGCEAVA